MERPSGMSIAKFRRLKARGHFDRGAACAENPQHPPKAPKAPKAPEATKPEAK